MYVLYVWERGTCLVHADWYACCSLFAHQSVNDCRLSLLLNWIPDTQKRHAYIERSCLFLQAWLTATASTTVTTFLLWKRTYHTLNLFFFADSGSSFFPHTLVRWWSEMREAQESEFHSTTASHVFILQLTKNFSCGAHSLNCFSSLLSIVYVYVRGEQRFRRVYKILISCPTLSSLW